MIDFEFDEYCCGCTACSSVCPVEAITMKKNKEGFLVPEVDLHRCIRCNKCEKVCSHLRVLTGRKICQDKGYACLFSSKDESVKLRSASGGAFYEIAKAYIEKYSAKICGCVWDSNLEAQHIIIDNTNLLYKMQGSKYVQSRVENCFVEILGQLKKGVSVVFSGTPCQCHALNNILEQEKNAKELKEKLLTVGIICHGVASPAVWDSYKEYEKKRRSTLINVNFRDKSKEGYRKSYCKLEFASGEVKFTPTYLPTSKYIESTIVYNLGIRRSCSHCDCKGFSQATDVILGDWFSDCSDSNFLGTSCVVACTEKGLCVIKDILEGNETLSCNEIIEKNSMICSSTILGSNYISFMEGIRDINFWDGVERYYPRKYIVKKILIKAGLYELFRTVRQKIK